MATLGRHPLSILGTAVLGPAVLGTALVVLLFCGAAAPAADAAVSGKSLAADLIARTNAVRKEAGCSPVKADERLRSVAQAHASDMARHRYLEHEDREGTSADERIGSAGFGNVSGENLAHGYASAADVMDVWMNSAGHRRNIEDCAFTHIGVGYAPSGSYWVQDFGG
jgi:uncharacterized protein YkwD